MIRHALARTERKSAPGYRGFTVHADPSVTLEDDLRRRDLTVNAIAEDEQGTLVDPFGGVADLRDHVLRHVSDAFAEDPVRILRLARFAARWPHFRIADATRALCRDMVAAGEVDAPFVPGTTTEIHPQAQAFVRSLAERLHRGAAFFIDYGFPDAEYYLPARREGTLMCHCAHRADADPLSDVGAKDITAHVDFSGIALAAQDAGFDVLGYTTQARFLLNCGLADALLAAQQRGDWAALGAAQKLVAEHEMGELFKVLGLVRGVAPFDAIGFAQGDRSHRL